MRIVKELYLPKTQSALRVDASLSQVAVLDLAKDAITQHRAKVGCIFNKKTFIVDIKQQKK